MTKWQVKETFLIFLISQKIAVIRNETEITRSKVIEVEVESERLTAELDGLEKRLQDLERQAEDEAELAKEVYDLSVMFFTSIWISSMHSSSESACTA